MLVCQIEAGGVGLNIQAASVVILCEPQVKPSIEAQAIARAHRMGQVRTVQVHRLLIEDSVDQRMLEMLGSKAQLFDAYVRHSAIAEAAPGAVDISEVQLARTIVAQEQHRLAGTPEPPRRLTKVTLRAEDDDVPAAAGVRGVAGTAHAGPAGRGAPPAPRERGRVRSSRVPGRARGASASPRRSRPRRGTRR